MKSVILLDWVKVMISQKIRIDHSLYYYLRSFSVYFINSGLKERITPSGIKNVYNYEDQKFRFKTRREAIQKIKSLYKVEKIKCNNINTEEFVIKEVK